MSSDYCIRGVLPLKEQNELSELNEVIQNFFNQSPTLANGSALHLILDIYSPFPAADIRNIIVHSDHHDIRIHKMEVHNGLPFTTYCYQNSWWKRITDRKADAIALLDFGFRYESPSENGIGTINIMLDAVDGEDWIGVAPNLRCLDDCVPLELPLMGGHQESQICEINYLTSPGSIIRIHKTDLLPNFPTRNCFRTQHIAFSRDLVNSTGSKLYRVKPAYGVIQKNHNDYVSSLAFSDLIDYQTDEVNWNISYLLTVFETYAEQQKSETDRMLQVELWNHAAQECKKLLIECVAILPKTTEERLSWIRCESRMNAIMSAFETVVIGVARHHS